ncbi:MAG: HEAT repeat domain-containing protein [Gemmataceae bacterium]
MQQKDADVQNIAIFQVRSLNTKALNELSSRLSTLPVPQQVALLRALANRGDSSQREVALKATRSKNETVQQAGLKALARLGNASDVPMLLEVMFANSAILQAAQHALQNIHGEGVNDNIILAMKKAKAAKLRKTLIDVLAVRRVAAALPVLLKETVCDEAPLRTSAMSALREIAEPKDVPKLIPGWPKAQQGNERRNAERTILTVCGRILEPTNRPEIILVAITPENKAALLPLLGSMGGPKTLALTREALDSKSPKLYEAGVVALSNWPNAKVSADLLRLARTAREPNLHRLAFRNLIRVNAIQNTETPKTDRLRMLKDAMKLANTFPKKKQVFAGLSKVRDIQTLRYVLPYLKDKELAQVACRTIVELAHSRNLRRPNQKEFIQAPNQVLAICDDDRLIERARKYKVDF